MDGLLSASQKAKIEFKMPEFDIMADFSAPLNITMKKYDVLCGRDLRQELGINIDFQHNVISWLDVKVPINK